VAAAVPLQEPCEAVADTSVARTGMRFVRTTFVGCIAPGRSVPSKQLTTLGPEQLPLVDSAETNVTWAGKRSRTTTPGA
jgi:hypothetical protein